LDPRASAPLNSYPITILLWMGLRPTYVLAHALATVLVSLQVLLSYLIFLRLGSRVAALLGAVSIVSFLWGHDRSQLSALFERAFSCPAADSGIPKSSVRFGLLMPVPI
jgi:hypothetical protein